MKRWVCFVFFVVLVVLTSFAQTLEIESRVLDASTGEPVPFATVRVPGGGSTIANESGGFAVEAALGDTLQVTSVGYVRALVAVGDVGPAVRLQPADVTLGGVTILSGAALMEGIVRKAKALAGFLPARLPASGRALLRAQLGRPYAPYVKPVPAVGHGRRRWFWRQST